MTAKGKEQCEELRRLWAHLEASKVITYTSIYCNNYMIVLSFKTFLNKCYMLIID